MKRDFKQWLSTILNKTNNYLSPPFIKYKKKPMTYDIDNSGLVLGQEKKCGSDKSVNGIPTLLFLMHEYQVI